MNHSLSVYADLAFVNGNVITVNSEDEIFTAVAVKRNIITYVGDDEGIRPWIGEQTRVIDLKGRSLLPGFIDAHMHLGMRGQNAAVILDCGSEAAPSIEDIKRIIGEAAAKAEPGQWIKATGYDQTKLKEGRHPTRWDLDEVAPNNPVQLTRICLHMGVYNSKALEVAGITGPEMFAPGQVVTDENGEMTGLLKEYACTFMWDKVVYTKEEYMRAFKVASDMFVSKGITSVHDASFYGSDTVGLYQDACKSGLIKVRMYEIVYHACGKVKTGEWVGQVLSTGIHGGLGDEHFRLGHVKILVDGSSSGPSCATRQPYSHDPELEGILLYTQEEADELLLAANRGGFDITAHAVGDAGVEIILTAIEHAMKDCPRPGARHRIEHCGIVGDDQIERIRKTGAVIISNPGFFSANAQSYITFYGDRAYEMFPLKKYLEKGIVTAIGSDTPVIEADPMIGLYSAMMRKDFKSGDVAGKEQGVSLLEAIRMYTYNGAFASHEEDIKGSIEPGKLADLVVLSENILDSDVEHILDIQADMTVIDGVVEYEREV